MGDKSHSEDVTPSTSHQSLQKRRDCYAAWKKSGLSKVAFCKMHSIPVSSFYSWSRQVDRQEKARPSPFVPIIAKVPAQQISHNTVQLEIVLANQSSLQMAMREDRLVSFIQELMNATAIVR